MVRSDPPAKTGLGPARAGLVAGGSRAPPEAVPRNKGVGFGCRARATMAASSAKAGVERARIQAAM